MSILNAQALSLAMVSNKEHCLRAGCAFPHPSPYSTVLAGTITTNTGIPEEDVGALVTVIVPNPINVWMPRKRPLFPNPKVICHESWIVREINWHAYLDGELCWEIAPKWQDQLYLMHKLNPAAVAEFAALYFLNSTAWLIGRHRLRHIFNLSNWRDDWLQWGHGKNGLIQYLHERNDKK